MAKYRKKQTVDAVLYDGSFELAFLIDGEEVQGAPNDAVVIRGRGGWETTVPLNWYAVRKNGGTPFAMDTTSFESKYEAAEGGMA